MTNSDELAVFLKEQQPRFNEDFAALLKGTFSMESGLKGHLEAIWARYNTLLALAERFAGRADAAYVESCRVLHLELRGLLDKKRRRKCIKKKHP